MEVLPDLWHTETRGDVINKGGVKMKTIAVMLSLVMVSPAFASGAWDGLRPTTEVYQAYDQVDHPPTPSAQSSVLATLGVVQSPVYQALTLGWTGTALWSEIHSFWFVPYGMIVGSYLEHRSNPRKFGKFQHNGHAVTGENVKWERDPDHVGWNRLKRYDTVGPGTQVASAKPFVHEYNY